MHPTDHISIEESYFVCIKISYGARYHLLTTWQVINFDGFCGKFGDKELFKPIIMLLGADSFITFYI